MSYTPYAAAPTTHLHRIRPMTHYTTLNNRYTSKGRTQDRSAFKQQRILLIPMATDYPGKRLWAWLMRK